MKRTEKCPKCGSRTSTRGTGDVATGAARLNSVMPELMSPCNCNVPPARALVPCPLHDAASPSFDPNRGGVALPPEVRAALGEVTTDRERGACHDMRERVKLGRIWLDGVPDPWAPALPLTSLRDTATALLERAEALDRDLNAGPVCRDPFLSGAFLAGACLERERRRCGRKPWKWDVTAMCAACAASHLASLTADRLRLLAREERERWGSLTLAALEVNPTPRAGFEVERAARRLLTLRAAHLGCLAANGGSL